MKKILRVLCFAVSILFILFGIANLIIADYFSFAVFAVIGLVILFILKKQKKKTANSDIPIVQEVDTTVNSVVAIDNEDEIEMPAYTGKHIRTEETVIRQAVKAEEEWRRQQHHMTPLEYELYKIDFMEGHTFENWCADLLKKNGFNNVSVTPWSNDQGVDIIAVKEGIKYAIQCKCYSTDLSNKPVQEVNTGKHIYHCQIGVVMTNRHFTTGAKTAAEATGVLLWDRDKIIEMLIRSGVSDVSTGI